LEQPNTVKVLGASLQASPNADVEAAERTRILQNLEAVLDRNGKVKDAKRLIEMARSGEVTLQYVNKIKRGNNPLDKVVVVKEVSKLDVETVDGITPVVTLTG
jgi:hypothetical protein